MQERSLSPRRVSPTEYGVKWRQEISGRKLPAAFDDRILTKSNHKAIMMIGKTKKHIIYSAEDKVLNIDQKDIEQYLSEVKDAVEKDNYRLDRNARRQDNINLFLDYVIDEAKAKEIILSLTAMDFSEILQNEHKGFEHEQLYIFGKDVVLLERTGTEEKQYPCISSSTSWKTVL